MVKRQLFGSLVVFCFLYGVAVGHYRVFPYHAIKKITHVIIPRVSARHADTGYKDVSEKQEVSCGTIDMTNTLVALTFGQSNSANKGQTRYSSANPVYNFYEGKWGKICYIMFYTKS